MSTFPNRRRLAGPECHRMLAISKHLIEYFLEKNTAERKCKNQTGIEFKSTARFSAKELDDMLIEEEKKIEEQPKLLSHAQLEIAYHERILKDLPKLKGKPILFTSALSIMETPPETEEYSSIIAEDYFSNNFRASREYLQAISKLASKDSRVLDTIVIALAPTIFPVKFSKHCMTHALPQTIQYANNNNKSVYRFGDLKKCLHTLDKPTKRNYAFNPSYFYGDPKFENKSDSLHYIKEKYRAINKTILAYEYAGLIKILELEVVRGYFQLGSYENKIMEKSAKMAGAKYEPAKAMKNVQPAKIGLCEEAAIRQFKKTVLSLYKNEERQLTLM